MAVDFLLAIWNNWQRMRFGYLVNDAEYIVSFFC